MKAIANILAILAIVTAVHAAEPDESWEIHGNVVDQQGNPVENFVAATYWSANGKQWDDDGKIMKFDEAELGEFWKEEGVLEAFPPHLAMRMGAGQFTVKVDKLPRVSIFVTDSIQQCGACVSVEKSAGDRAVTVTLVPLVRVTGKVYCSEAKKAPGWTMAIIHPPGDMGNFLQFIRCGSINARFSLLLPPGKFDLDVYSERPDAHMPKPIQRKKRDAPADMPNYVVVHVL